MQSSATATIEKGPIAITAEPAAATPAKKGSHLPALDSIRGVAVLCVMVYHFNNGPSDVGAVGNVLSKLFRLGGSGVDLFFVLSGFLITGILFDAKQEPYYFRNFYIRRTLRIFPLYYGVLAVCFLILPCFNVVVDQDALQNQGWLWLYGTNLIQAWNDSYLFGGFDHFWSLAVEEHFYLLWPLIIYACNRKTAMWVCLACAVAALGCRVGLLMGGSNAVGAYVLTPCRMDALAVGGFIALAVRTPEGTTRWVRFAVISLAASMLLLAYLLVVKIDLNKMDAITLSLRSTLSACFFGAILFFAVHASPASMLGRCWNIGFLRFFGKYSYGLYVFHHPMIPLFDYFFSPYVLAEKLHSALYGRLVYAALAIAVTVVMAMVSYHLYEKHFLKLKDALAPKPQAA
jgi:peptidoglycan/LPS O-acetylase OafA/YrhL